MLVLFIRVIILYSLVLLVLRLMGKRQISEFQPFELVVTIMIAEFASTPLSDVHVPILSGIIPLITLLFLQIILSLITYKSKKIRDYVCGKPQEIIKNGKFNQHKFKEMLLSFDDIISSLMINSSDITKIDSFIIETNGSVSITTFSDKGAVITLVENGIIIQNQIDELNISMEHFYSEMKKHKIDDITQIFWSFHYNNIIYFIKKEV